MQCNETRNKQQREKWKILLYEEIKQHTFKNKYFKEEITGKLGNALEQMKMRMQYTNT